MADSLFKLLVFALAIVQLKEETVYHFPQVTIGDLKLLDDDLKGNSFLIAFNNRKKLKLKNMEWLVLNNIQNRV